MAQQQLEHIEDFTYEEIIDLSEKTLNFTELFCAVEFYPYQKEMGYAILKDVLGNLGNVLTGLFSRQSGKSETVANIGAALMVLIPKLASLRDENNKFIFPQLLDYRKGFRVGIFSPSTTQSSTTYKRLRDKLTSQEARAFLDTPEFVTNGVDKKIHFLSNSSTYTELSNGSFCLMMSADKKSNIESKTFDLILLDESQDLDEYVVSKSIMPMGSSTNATAVATGTPGTIKNFFYRQIEFNKVEQINRQRPDKTLQPQMHFEYDYKTVQRHNKKYKKRVAQEKKRIGEESDEFKMAYRLIWLLERGMAVPKELFEDLTRKDLKPVSELKNVPLVAGLDWGKGADSTVLTIGMPLWDRVDEQGRAPVEVIYWWEKVGDDYEAIFAEVKEKLSNFSVQTLACDATGVGEPLVDRLQYELPYVTVLPVKFSAQSKDHLYKFFLLMTQEKKVWWPGYSEVRKRNYWKNFEQQMLNLQKEYKGQYLTCHAPEDMKNAHDDYPDSLALMLWCINEEAMPFIEVGEQSDTFKGRDWHQFSNTQQFSLRG